jgi:predicted nucleic acid-binding protein
MRSTSVRFVDTNVLLYAISQDPTEQSKASTAAQILAERDLALSVQVLQEFYVQATRESRDGSLSHDQAAALVDSFMRFPIQETTRVVMTAAFETRHRYCISYWDAAIIEAARALGCERVLSEDLGDGQDYGGVVVEDPFRAR